MAGSKAVGVGNKAGRPAARPGQAPGSDKAPRRQAVQRGQAFVGSSGWSYDHWVGLVYPERAKPRDWLAHYAKRLGTVEINASFYHLPKPEMLEGWAERTPAGFRFAVKAWRRITHYRRLVDCAEPLTVFIERVAALGPKLGPVLFQLPPRFGLDLDRLTAFLALLPEDRRFAFEFRDPSWHVEPVYRALAAKNAAFCPFQLGKLAGPRVVTADFVYVRLHGPKARYRGDYSKAALAGWAKWLRTQMKAGYDTYVYFDNTDEADYAVRDAERLAAMLAEPSRKRRA
ncbi:MAG: DUF72 domain-containing protein [Pseudomonadota bacterium]